MISFKYVHGSFELLCSWLLIILCIHQFFTTHSTDSFLIRTGLTVMRSHLVNLLPTYSADLEFCGVRIKSCLSRGKSFVLTDLTTSTFRRVPCACLPRIRSNNLAQFLLAFLANHVLLFRQNATQTKSLSENNCTLYHISIWKKSFTNFKTKLYYCTLSLWVVILFQISSYLFIIRIYNNMNLFRIKSKS